MFDLITKSMGQPATSSSRCDRVGGSGRGRVTRKCLFPRPPTFALTAVAICWSGRWKMASPVCQAAAFAGRYRTVNSWDSRGMSSKRNLLFRPGHRKRLESGFGLGSRVSDRFNLAGYRRDTSIWESFQRLSGSA